MKQLPLDCGCKNRHLIARFFCKIRQLKKYDYLCIIFYKVWKQ